MSGQPASETRLLYGFHAIGARLRHDAGSVLEAFVDEARRDARARRLAAEIAAAGVAVHAVPRARLDALAGHREHQGVVARVRAQERAGSLGELLDALADAPLLLVLDEVQDPRNLGACLRCADAFAAHAVVAPRDRAAALTPVVAKVASGATETVPMFFVTNLARTLRELKDRGIWVLGAEASGTETLDTADLSGPIAWVLGAEGSGLRRLTREHCDRLVRIPIAGSVGSLNVAVAAGVCLYATHAARRRAGTLD